MLGCEKPGQPAAARASHNPALFNTTAAAASHRPTLPPAHCRRRSAYRHQVAPRCDFQPNGPRSPAAAENGGTAQPTAVQPSPLPLLSPQTAKGSTHVVVNGGKLGTADSACKEQAALAERLNELQLNGIRPPSGDAPPAPAASLDNSTAAAGPGVPAADTAAGSSASGAEGAEEAGEPFSLVQRLPLAGGSLELVRLEGRRLLRVWLPPGGWAGRR